MPSVYVALAVDASIDCQACGEPITLRAMEARVPCPACGAGCAIAWAELIFAAIQAHASANASAAAGSEAPPLFPGLVLPTFRPGERLSGATPGATIEVDAEVPGCSGCKAPWDDALLEKIDTRTRAMACAACGHEESARLVPASIAQKLPSARWVIGEETPAAVSNAPGTRRTEGDEEHRFHVIFRPE